MQHVDIFGGLGNQMFQYAYYISRKNHGDDVVPDISIYKNDKKQLMHNGFELTTVFAISENNFYSSFLSKLLIKLSLMFNWREMICRDTVHSGYQDFFKVSSIHYMHGFWQSEKYFKDVEELIRQIFIFKDIDKRNLDFGKKLSYNNPHTSVSIHVRRGDYLKYNMKVVDWEYYSQAISYISSKISNPKFYVFSDDIESAINIVEKAGVNYETITFNTGKDSYKDMFLMSQCKHNIIANSSFSWWGAWLNSNKDKIVVAPNWGKDFVCEDWITINV